MLKIDPTVANFVHAGEIRGAGNFILLQPTREKSLGSVWSFFPSPLMTQLQQKVQIKLFLKIFFQTTVAPQDHLAWGKAGKTFSNFPKQRRWGHEKNDISLLFIRV